MVLFEGLICLVSVKKRWKKFVEKMLKKNLLKKLEKRVCFAWR